MSAGASDSRGGDGKCIRNRNSVKSLNSGVYDRETRVSRRNQMKALGVVILAH